MQNGSGPGPGEPDGVAADSDAGPAPGFGEAEPGYGDAAAGSGDAAPADGETADDGAIDDGAIDDGVVPAQEDGGPGLRASLEAIMLVADEPVPDVVIAQVLERPRAEVTDALAELAASYTAEERGFDLREVAGGWRFYTREECAPVVERFVSDGQEVRLTQAALETLAVVAYRQPVSRARVSAVRGVNCDGVIRTLGHRPGDGRDPVRDHVVLPGAARAARPGCAARTRPVPARLH
jgi:segregation and condensation protein B